MANTIDSIPEKTGWEIATKGMTGAYIAISKALKDVVGPKKFEELNGSLWFEAGKGAKEFHVQTYQEDAPWRRALRMGR